MSLDLDAIKARYAHYGPKVAAGTAVADVRELLAEVERLRGYTETTRYHQQQSAETFREVERLRAAIRRAVEAADWEPGDAQRALRELRDTVGGLS